MWEYQRLHHRKRWNQRKQIHPLCHWWLERCNVEFYLESMLTQLQLLPFHNITPHWHRRGLFYVPQARRWTDLLTQWCQRRHGLPDFLFHNLEVKTSLLLTHWMNFKLKIAQQRFCRFSITSRHFWLLSHPQRTPCIFQWRGARQNHAERFQWKLRRLQVAFCL